MALGNASHSTPIFNAELQCLGDLGIMALTVLSRPCRSCCQSDYLFIYVCIYLFTFVCGTLGTKGRKDKTNWKDWRSGSPLSTKIWCNRIALKRYSVTDNRRYYKFLFISMTNNSYKRMSVKFPRKCSCRDGDNGQFLQRSG